MRREQMVEALVIDSLVNIVDQARFFWLQGILEKGFQGFANMSDDDLRAEIARRRLGSEALEIVDDPCLEEDSDTHSHAISELARCRRDARAFEAD